MESSIDTQHQWIAQSLASLPDIAHALLEFAGEHRVWLFNAPMGTGKTTLIKALGSALGVTENMSSPTFGLVNEYRDKNNTPVFHFDCYRLEDEEEAFDIGIEEYFESGNYCWVEWPSKIEGLWPDCFLYVELALTENNARSITASVVNP